MLAPVEGFLTSNPSAGGSIGLGQKRLAAEAAAPIMASRGLTANGTKA